MYFKLKINEIDKTRSQKRINFESISFCDFLYEDTINLYSNLKYDQKNKIIIADFIGAIIRKLFECDYLRNEQIIDMGLDNCTQILIDMGFELTNIKEIYQLINRNYSSYIVLVPGCQDRGLINNRIKKTVDLYINLSTELKIVFSGACPDNESQNKRIWNEANKMCNEFHAQLKGREYSLKYGINDYTIKLEKKANRSFENIKKFMEGNFLDQDKKNNIFLVSSSFHLIRLANILIDYILEKKISNIENIFLVGSEVKYRYNEIPNPNKYIKFLFFEIYNYLLNKNKFNF